MELLLGGCILLLVFHHLAACIVAVRVLQSRRTARPFGWSDVLSQTLYILHSNHL